MKAGSGVPCCQDAAATAVTIGSAPSVGPPMAATPVHQHWEQRPSQQVGSLRVQAEQAAVEVISAFGPDDSVKSP